jgi:hypothetical protein
LAWLSGTAPIQFEQIEILAIRQNKDGLVSNRLAKTADTVFVPKEEWRREGRWDQTFSMPGAK